MGHDNDTGVMLKTEREKVRLYLLVVHAEIFTDGMMSRMTFKITWEGKNGKRDKTRLAMT